MLCGATMESASQEVSDEEVTFQEGPATVADKDTLAKESNHSTQSFACTASEVQADNEVIFGNHETSADSPLFANALQKWGSIYRHTPESERHVIVKAVRDEARNCRFFTSQEDGLRRLKESALDEQVLLAHIRVKLDEETAAPPSPGKRQRSVVFPPGLNEDPSCSLGHLSVGSIDELFDVYDSSEQAKSASVTATSHQSHHHAEAGSALAAPSLKRHESSSFDRFGGSRRTPTDGLGNLHPQAPPLLRAQTSTFSMGAMAGLGRATSPSGPSLRSSDSLAIWSKIAMGNDDAIDLPTGGDDKYTASPQDNTEFRHTQCRNSYVLGDSQQGTMLSQFSTASSQLPHNTSTATKRKDFRGKPFSLRTTSSKKSKNNRSGTSPLPIGLQNAAKYFTQSPIGMSLNTTTPQGLSTQYYYPSVTPSPHHRFMSSPMDLATHQMNQRQLTRGCNQVVGKRSSSRGPSPASLQPLQPVTPVPLAPMPQHVINRFMLLERHAHALHEENEAMWSRLSSLEESVQTTSATTTSNEHTTMPEQEVALENTMMATVNEAAGYSEGDNMAENDQEHETEEINKDDDTSALGKEEEQD